jgi:hypothetical protein
MEWIIVIALIVGAVFAWRNRVRLLAKLLGQPERRIQNAIERRKQGRR